MKITSESGIAFVSAKIIKEGKEDNFKASYKKIPLDSNLNIIHFDNNINKFIANQHAECELECVKSDFIALKDVKFKRTYRKMGENEKVDYSIRDLEKVDKFVALELENFIGKNLKYINSFIIKKEPRGLLICERL